MNPVFALLLAFLPADAVIAGFSYRTIGDDEANEIGVEGGVVVGKIAAGTPAEKAGLRKGDIIQEINGRRCDTAEDWQRVLGKGKPGDVVKFIVIRDKKDVTVELTLEART
jgi:serine protease Do